MKHPETQLLQQMIEQLHEASRTNTQQILETAKSVASLSETVASIQNQIVEIHRSSVSKDKERDEEFDNVMRSMQDIQNFNNGLKTYSKVSRWVIITIVSGVFVLVSDAKDLFSYLLHLMGVK